jgi:hypothetical protein
MKFLLIAIAVLFCACTNPNGATKVLRQQGYTDIEMTGYKFFACSHEDFYHTGFRAKSAAGYDVEGCVCEGLFFKNSTIRLK